MGATTSTAPATCCRDAQGATSAPERSARVATPRGNRGGAARRRVAQSDRHGPMLPTRDMDGVAETVLAHY